MLGAATLAVGSLQCVRDKQFQRLSVSAEQWLPLVEVGAKGVIIKIFIHQTLSSTLSSPVHPFAVVQPVIL